MINSFFRNLFEFGISRIILSWDFIFSVFFCIVAFILEKCYGVVLSINYELIITILMALFAFVFAALAIVISLSDENFLRLLKEKKVLKKLLFHYWYACVIFLISTIYVYTLEVFNIKNGFRFGALFFSLYALGLTIELVKTTISFGYYREASIDIKI